MNLKGAPGPNGPGMKARPFREASLPPYVGRSMRDFLARARQIGPGGEADRGWPG